MVASPFWRREGLPAGSRCYRVGRSKVRRLHMFGEVVDEVVGNLGGGVGAAEVGGGAVVVEGGLDGVFERVGFVVPAEKFNNETRSEDGAERVGNSLPGDSVRRAVDGLEERGAAGVDVAGGGEAEAAGELRGEVANDVAEEIVGDDDVELAGLADELHGQCVDE